MGWGGIFVSVLKEAKQRMLNDTEYNDLSDEDAKIRLNIYIKELNEEIKAISGILR